MNKESIGSTIAKLRRANGMTQLALAERLNVSDKAVSKWENGQGYPDITIIPELAALFGVTIDYIMLGEKKGIAVAGTIVADIVKNIDYYPEAGMLSHISNIAPSVGGCAPNTAIDLAKIDHSLPISVLGKVGTDDNGRYIISQLQKNGINVDQVAYGNTETSFCDVMSMPSGERTFFLKRGANDEFCPEDINLSALNCDILHIGYIHLLEKFDAKDPKYGTVMARFLHDVQSAGIRTSIDMVSDSSADFAGIVIPALKYCNYVIINEIECSSVWGIEPRDASGRLIVANIKDAMERMAQHGVKDKVIVHAKEAAFLLDVESGDFSSLGSFILPSSEIKGSVGAGDAFCAGALYGLFNGYTDMGILEFASSAAACSLFAANAVDGMRSRNEIIKLYDKYERKEV